MASAATIGKRTRDSPSQPYEASACSPHRAAMLLESPASKRTRAHGDCAVTSGGSNGPPSAFLPATNGVAGATSALPVHPMADLAVPQPPPQPVNPPPPQRFDPQTGEHLFSMEQVRDIVRRAVEEKERTLRAQYDAILQQKLNEQFQSFAKFNEDYISRSLKTNDLSYCS